MKLFPHPAPRRPGRAHPRGRLLTLCALLLAFAGEVAAAPLLYVVREFDPELRVVDAADASTVSTHTLSLAGETVLGGSGLARDPISGDLYALLWLDGQTGRELVKLDGGTGAVTQRIGDTGDFFTAITFAGDGTLYGLTHDLAATPYTLFTLSLADATPSFEATLGNGGSGEALAMADDGLLYHASGYPGAGGDPIFESVDPGTFAIGSLSYSGDLIDEVLGLTSTGGGALYATDYLGGPGSGGVSDLYTITTGGVVSRIGHLGFSDARGIAIVPEPGTALLLGLGLSLLGARRARRSR